MMNKNGQVTVFIIIGVVLIIGAGFYFYLTGLERARPVQEQALEVLGKELDRQVITSYVESCIQSVLAPGVFLLARNGGYIYFHDKVLAGENEEIAYHLEYGEDVSISKERMEQELSRFIRNSMGICLNELEALQQYDVTYGDIEVETTIGELSVFTRITYPVTITVGDAKTTVSDFSAEVPIRLKHVLGIKDDIISGLKESRWIDLDRLASYDAEVTVLPYNEESAVYSIWDRESTIRNSDFRFNFAVKTAYEPNEQPTIDPIDAQVAYVGEEFNITINASDANNDRIIFRDNTALFEIHPVTGKISFTPSEADEGLYLILIAASDGKIDGLEEFMLSVTER